MDKDYYKILGVARDATEEQIKKAYRQKALIFHPDKNKSPGAQEQFKVIKRAYEILSDKDRRRQYDLTQRPTTSGANSSSSSSSSSSSNNNGSYGFGSYGGYTSGGPSSSSGTSNYWSGCGPSSTTSGFGQKSNTNTNTNSNNNNNYSYSTFGQSQNQSQRPTSSSGQGSGNSSSFGSNNTSSRKPDPSYGQYPDSTFGQSQGTSFGQGQGTSFGQGQGASFGPGSFGSCYGPFYYGHYPGSFGKSPGANEWDFMYDANLKYGYDFYRSYYADASKGSTFGQNQNQSQSQGQGPSFGQSQGSSSGQSQGSKEQSKGNSYGQSQSQGQESDPSSNKDPSINHQLFVTPEELEKGCTKNMKITRNITELDGLRRKVSKVLTITVHVGWKAGTKITFPEEGDLDLQSKRTPADIIFIVTVKPKSNTNSSTNDNDNESEPDNKSEKAEQQTESKRKRSKWTNKKKKNLRRPELAETFEELNLRSELLRGVHSMGFTSPNYVQDKCLPTLLKSIPFNIIALTELKTGKIAAFCIAALNKVTESLNETQVVILAPTQQLVLRIGSILKEIGRFCENTTVLMLTQEEAVNNAKVNAHIMVGTPGSVMDAHNNQRFDVSKIRLLVVDNMDELTTDSGYHGQHTEFIRLVPKRAKKLFFSSVSSSDTILYFLREFPRARVLEFK